MDLPIFKRYFNVTGSYRYHKKFKFPGESEVNSFITGMTLGLSYTQKDVSLKAYWTGIFLNYEIKGRGVLNYVLFFEGIGTYYTEAIEFNAFKSGRHFSNIDVWRI